MSFPYEKRFRHYLATKRILERNTQDDICRDVADLFNYLRHFNSLYQKDPDLSKLEESDIRDYLNMLQTKRGIKPTTYNKVLTHLNVYFSFLFSEKLSKSMPTLALKGLKRPQNSPVPLTWQTDLHLLLENDQLSYYTRLMLLLLAHYYPINEILRPGFYQILQTEKFTPEEEKFLEDFRSYIAPRQLRQQSDDLFLKQRFNLAEPQLTLPALHKYLKADQEVCHLPLAPRKLYQAATFNYIKTNQNATDQELCERLRLDGTSLNYYRQELHKLD